MASTAITDRDANKVVTTTTNEEKEALDVNFTEEVVLKGKNEDKLTLTINDDLSGLLYFKVSASGKIEKRE